MEFRQLGRSGLKVSAVGLGCNNFGMTLDEAGTKTVVDAAIDAGITLFDTANVYGSPNLGGSETFLGKALGNRRARVLIATKFGVSMGDSWELQGGGSRDTVMRAAEASLKRLGTDYIDLYQIHTPDPTTPIEETLRALDDLVRQGKVRYIGHSNFAGWQTSDAAWISQIHHLVPFVSAQNRYSVLSRAIETDLVPACVAHGVGVLPYFPLESGLLTGKYKQKAAPPEGTRFAAWAKRGPELAGRFFSDDKIAIAEQLGAIAAETGGSTLDLAFGWLLSKPYVPSVIAGATKPEQIVANIKAGTWRPNADQLKRIDALSPPPEKVGF